MKYLKLFEDFISEGVYDSIVRLVTKDIIQQWKEDFEMGESSSLLDDVYYKAKKIKKPFKKVLDEYLIKSKLSKKEKDGILKRWRMQAKSMSLPTF